QRHWRRRPPYAVREHPQLRGLGCGRGPGDHRGDLLLARGQTPQRDGAAMIPGGHLVSVLIFFPPLAALALLFLRGEAPSWIRRLALVISLAEFGFSLLLLHDFQPAQRGYQLEEAARWISSPPINYHVGVDGISLFLVILTTLLTAISVLASWQSVEKRVKEFFVALLLLEVGVVGVFLSLDLFLFFLFW